MKKYYLVVVACICALGMTACGNRATQGQSENERFSAEQGQEDESSDGNPMVEIQNYEHYSGDWSVGGISHDTLLRDGGAELHCTIINGNEFSGRMYTQQELTDRVAEIDGIAGTIENGELYYNFEDDGFEGSGTLYIQFLENRIRIEVLDYHMAESNLSGYGISGVYEMTRLSETVWIPEVGQDPSGDVLPGTTKGELTYAEMLDKFYERHYSGMSPEELETFINLRADYYRASTYHDEVVYYWENTREVRDVANVLEPLYFTDMKYYTKEDFADDPPLIINLAKNEIYARWGYIFKNQDLQNYFMGCAWYEPLYTAEEFDTSVFNEYERKNLELLAELDAQ
ncbi:MAG: YARHG domain-containing protein [Acetatifactor sp.]|nr:YARHG domain-containing protein [Acetatifactor sp.]